MPKSSPLVERRVIYCGDNPASRQFFLSAHRHTIALTGTEILDRRFAEKTG